MATKKTTRPQIAAGTDQLVSAMRRLHGGRWVATIDHKQRFILIRARQPKRRGHK